MVTILVFLERLFSKANANPNKAKPTAEQFLKNQSQNMLVLGYRLTNLPTWPGRQTILSSPYSSHIVLQLQTRRSAVSNQSGIPNKFFGMDAMNNQ